MPRFDGTGPMGTGSIGRGLGPCGGGQARGRGCGFGRGNFGLRMGQFAAPQPETKEVMEQRKDWLEKQLAAISQRLQDLETK
jgi:hypothetical protein